MCTAGCYYIRMTKKHVDVEAMQALLAAEKDQLEEALQSHGKKVNGDWEGSSADAQSGEMDPNTVADQIEELATNIPLAEELESRYRQVQSALKRIDQGKYGTCEVCGIDVPADRLEANPAASTCIEHAE